MRLDAKFTSIDATWQSELLIKFVRRSLQVWNIKSGTFETEHNEFKELDGAEKMGGGNIDENRHKQSAGFKR